MTGVITAIVAGIFALAVPFFRYAARERIILAKLKDEATVLSELPDGDARRLLGQLMHQRIEIYVRVARPAGDSVVDVILLGLVTLIVGLAALAWALFLTPGLVKASEAAQFLAILGLILVFVGPLMIVFSDRLAGSRRRPTRKPRDGDRTGGEVGPTNQRDADEKATKSGPGRETGGGQG